jgi:hypothetical protein
MGKMAAAFPYQGSASWEIQEVLPDGRNRVMVERVRDSRESSAWEQCWNMVAVLKRRQA